ncbi:ferrochelatase [soil metagenome]
MKFSKEPAHVHGANPKGSGTAIVLCNLGTPDAPTASAVRRYLAEFLMDSRVVEIPKLVWWPILHGIILRVRPAKSAARYAGVWMKEGSPLKVWTEKQAVMLAGYLGERGHAVTVLPAMRYGNPSVAAQLDKLKAEGATRILVLPLYPQYAAATTASVFDAVYAWAGRARHVPELRFANQYHDDAGYIDALALRVQEHWAREGRGEMLVMSFHGIPKRSLTLGDPYHCQCHKTGRLLAERLGLGPNQYKLTFQSRFGRAEWLQPYTEPTLRVLAQAGVKRVDLVCPGFVSDCLETLEEIAQEGRDAFMGSGGAEFHYIACLNDQHAWIKALSAIAINHLQGWPTALPSAGEERANAAQRQRALALGATD